MEMTTFEITCSTQGCGIVFWITKGFDDRRRSDHKTFYCPNGHTMSYPGMTDAQKLANEKAECARLLNERFALQNRLDSIEAKRRKRSARKAPSKKARKS